MMMPLFIEWHKKYEIGNHLIDEQHRGIVSIINTLYYTTRRFGPDNPELNFSILKNIQHYSRDHFITEEDIMETIGYPGIGEQKEQHRKLIVEMGHMERSVRRYEFAAIETKPLLDFLKEWWIVHINQEDRSYMPYLLSYIESH